MALTSVVPNCLAKGHPNICLAHVGQLDFVVAWPWIAILESQFQKLFSMLLTIKACSALVQPTSRELVELVDVVSRGAGCLQWSLLNALSRKELWMQATLA